MTDIFKNNFKHLLIIIICFTIDRISKYFVIKSSFENVSLNEFLNIDLVWNTGIGFGLFQLQPDIWYHILSVFIFSIILIVIYLGLREKSFIRYGYALIVGGAIGNLYDRITFYAVPDFIDLHYENFHWFTFNIADIFVTIGIIFLIMFEILKSKK